MRSGADVVVVGGRVAGTLTALRLARAGVVVRLLESTDEPGDTLSTHFFRGDGLVGSLDEIGVLDEVMSTGAPPLSCEYFSLDGAPFVQGPPQEPGSVGYCLSVRRATLDPILFRHAIRAGVDVRAGTRVVEVLRSGDAVVGVVDRTGERHGGHVVVGADGRRSTVAGLVGAVDEERHEPARAMYYRYATDWRPQDPIGPEFLLDGDVFAYAFPSEAGTTCVAVSIPVAEHHPSRAQAAARLDRVLRANPCTADQLDALTWSSDIYQGLPADSVWRTGSGEGWVLVGDSGTSQDPWAGLGMDTAARQARAFADSYLEAPEAWAAPYERLRHEETYAGFAETTRLAPDLRQMLG